MGRQVSIQVQATDGTAPVLKTVEKNFDGVKQSAEKNFGASSKAVQGTEAQVISFQRVTVAQLNSTVKATTLLREEVKKLQAQEADGLATRESIASLETAKKRILELEQHAVRLRARLTEIESPASKATKAAAELEARLERKMTSRLEERFSAVGISMGAIAAASAGAAQALGVLAKGFEQQITPISAMEGQVGSLRSALVAFKDTAEEADLQGIAGSIARALFVAYSAVDTSLAQSQADQAARAAVLQEKERQRLAIIQQISDEFAKQSTGMSYLGEQAQKNQEILKKHRKEREENARRVSEIQLAWDLKTANESSAIYKRFEKERAAIEAQRGKGPELSLAAEQRYLQSRLQLYAEYERAKAEMVKAKAPAAKLNQLHESYLRADAQLELQVWRETQAEKVETWLAAQEQMRQRRLAIEESITRSLEQKYEEQARTITGPLMAAFDTLFDQIMDGHIDAAKVGQAALRSLAGAAMNALAQYMVKRIAEALAEKAITGAVGGTQVGTAAAVGMANTMASISAIPIVGPALAPAAGAAMYTAIMTAGMAEIAAAQAAQGVRIPDDLGVQGRDSVLVLAQGGERILSREDTRLYEQGERRRSSAPPMSFTMPMLMPGDTAAFDRHFNRYVVPFINRAFERGAVRAKRRGGR